MHDIVFSVSTESVMNIILSLVETLYSQLEGLYTMFHTLKRSFTHLHRKSSQFSNQPQHLNTFDNAKSQHSINVLGTLCIVI